jgi:hypothetical protein
MSRKKCHKCQKKIPQKNKCEGGCKKSVRCQKPSRYQKPYPIRCKGEYTPCDLNYLLIPAKISHLSYERQVKYVKSPYAEKFRHHVKELYEAMVKADYNIGRGSCANPFNVTWQSRNGKFVINGKSLSKYYCFYLGDNKGFSGLIYEILEFCRREEYVCALKRNGKYCSPGRC